MATPLSRVRHFGSAREGTGHFWRQRITAAANAILVIALIGVLFTVVRAPYAEAAVIIGSPVVATLLILFFVSVAIHMRLGMQTIVEDYIHGEALKVVILIASTFFSIAVAAVSILAVLKLALGVL